MVYPGNVYPDGKAVYLNADLTSKTQTKQKLPSQDETLRILQWNCGGLTQQKKTELMKVMSDENIDLFIIIEANKTTEEMEKFKVPGFALHILEKSRKIASGIIVGVKNHQIYGE